MSFGSICSSVMPLGAKSASDVSNGVDAFYAAIVESANAWTLLDIGIHEPYHADKGVVTGDIDVEIFYTVKSLPTPHAPPLRG
jgi:thiazole synthase ThiGH ThiG subunit